MTSHSWLAIDGTKGFLRGDQFAVCVSLAIDADRRHWIPEFSCRREPPRRQKRVSVRCRQKPRNTAANSFGRRAQIHLSASTPTSSVHLLGSFESSHSSHSTNSSNLRMVAVLEDADTGYGEKSG